MLELKASLKMFRLIFSHPGTIADEPWLPILKTYKYLNFGEQSAQAVILTNYERNFPTELSWATLVKRSNKF
jgi:hypothetical protein